jgi:uncharacterized protein YegP (UPF0339 family)
MSTPRHENRRGTRHLRVGIEIQPGGVGVASVWLVDQPVIQASRLVEPVLVRTDLGGVPVLVEAFADPRVIRGTYQEGLGHSYRVEKSGVVEVSVPFTDPPELANLRIRVAEVSGTALPATDPREIAALFDNPPESMRIVGEVDTDRLGRHRDWPKVAATLGLGADLGRFEVYLDRAGQYRWRLRRATGEIVAESGLGYPSREACEASLLWIRGHASTLPVVALDLPGGAAGTA